jgi:hypothetical protein
MVSLDELRMSFHSRLELAPLWSPFPLEVGIHFPGHLSDLAEQLLYGDRIVIFRLVHIPCLGQLFFRVLYLHILNIFCSLCSLRFPEVYSLNLSSFILLLHPSSSSCSTSMFWPSASPPCLSFHRIYSYSKFMQVGWPRSPLLLSCLSNQALYSSSDSRRSISSAAASASSAVLDSTSQQGPR